MSIDCINLEDEENRFAVQNKWLQNSPTIPVDEREDAASIRKTRSIAVTNLTPPTPHSTDRSLAGRATKGHSADIVSTNGQNAHPLTEIQADLSQAMNSLEEIQEKLNSDNPPEPSTLEFPNLAWEAVKAGLAKEKVTNDQLSAHIKNAEKLQKDIDLLLDFSAELTAHREGTEISEKMKNLLDELKERGIDLWKAEEKQLSKEKISEIKSLANSQIDKSRSNLQIIFTTKIQTLIQSIGAIMETIKDIIRNNTRLINTANRLPGR